MQTKNIIIFYQEPDIYSVLPLSKVVKSRIRPIETKNFFNRITKKNEKPKLPVTTCSKSKAALCDFIEPKSSNSKKELQFGESFNKIQFDKIVIPNFYQEIDSGSVKKHEYDSNKANISEKIHKPKEFQSRLSLKSKKGRKSIASKKINQHVIAFKDYIRESNSVLNIQNSSNDENQSKLSTKTQFHDIGFNNSKYKKIAKIIPTRSIKANTNEFIVFGDKKDVKKDIENSNHSQIIKSKPSCDKHAKQIHSDEKLKIRQIESNKQYIKKDKQIIQLKSLFIYLNTFVPKDKYIMYVDKDNELEVNHDQSSLFHGNNSLNISNAKENKRFSLKKLEELKKISEFKNSTEIPDLDKQMTFDEFINAEKENEKTNPTSVLYKNYENRSDRNYELNSSQESNGRYSLDDISIINRKNIIDSENRDMTNVAERERSLTDILVKYNVKTNANLDRKCYALNEIFLEEKKNNSKNLIPVNINNVSSTQYKDSSSLTTENFETNKSIPPVKIIESRRLSYTAVERTIHNDIYDKLEPLRKEISRESEFSLYICEDNNEIIEIPPTKSNLNLHRKECENNLISVEEDKSKESIKIQLQIPSGMNI